MAIYEFKCTKCGHKKEFFGTYELSKQFEHNSACECSGKYDRLISQVAAAQWHTDTATASHGKQNMAETEKKGGK